MAAGTNTTSAIAIRVFSDAVTSELGSVLVRKGKVTQQQIDELNVRKALTGDGIDVSLIKESLVSEAELLAELSLITNIPYRPIAEFTIQPEAVNKIAARAALRYRVMPLEFDGTTLKVACNRVPDQATVDGLKMLLGCPVEWVLCTKLEVEQSLKHFYGLGAETVDGVIHEKGATEIELEETDIALDTADPGVVKFVNQIIFEAIKLDATDIHMEPFENRLRLRFRVDGLLQEVPIPTGIENIQKSIASCVKIMAQMNIAERRKPHDGRIKVKAGREEFDLRVSVLPTRFGETVNMRILSRKSMFIDLEHLGLMSDQRPNIDYLTSLPHGIVLLTGPTGSGKTTSLYAMLSTINTLEVKIITVEDPVEYHLHGINQIQVHPQVGLDFSNILRHILRHDPDIILIGEIRDRDTADIAVRAALTGHLVFSTLHTNDAPSAITRLIDMGVEPYLVASCLEGVVAQRLVRRVCRSCAKPTTPDEVVREEIEGMLPGRLGAAKFLKAAGCPNCSFTGYRGRVAIFEVMVMDDVLRSMVSREKTSAEIRIVALKKGLIVLRQNGWVRAMEGATTIEEVMRVARKLDLSSVR